jgi:cellulose biosynthesis protein BcsQ
VLGALDHSLRLVPSYLKDHARLRKLFPMRRLLGKITHWGKVATYDYVLFDCPPSFTLLSYSVLSCCDLVLIPVNPDFFASRGVSLLLNSLKMRIEPHPTPQIAVFMNKADTRITPTNETLFYMRQIDQIALRQGSSREFVLRSSMMLGSGRELASSARSRAEVSRPTLCKTSSDCGMRAWEC